MTAPRTRVEHDLKCWSEYFEKLLAGLKTFEVRMNDRDFQEGDILILREYNPATSEYTGRVLRRYVTYVMDLAPIGAVGYCAMAIR